MTTDNYAVMMVTNYGVESKLKLLVPNLVTNGCTCHILNLVSYAVLKSSIPNRIDKFTNDINYHFCNSSTEGVTSPNIKNILVLIFTRWLSRE